MIGRKTKYMAVFLSALMLLTACKKDKVMDRDGNMLEYTMSELKSKEGFFVRVERSSNDVVFQPLLNPDKVGIMSFSSTVRNLKNQSSRYIMVMEDRENLIPVITGNNLLILIDDNSVIPSEFEFEKFSDGGYTFGGTFYSNENSKGLKVVNGSYNKNFAPESDMKDVWSDKKNVSLYSLDTIGDTPIGAKNIDGNGVFQGLTKDLSYEFQCYVGTKYEIVSVKADTHYFVSESVLRMTQKDCVNKTKNGFVIISIPKDLPSGYYLVNGSYFFYYDAENVTNIPVTDRYSYLELETEPSKTDGSETTESTIDHSWPTIDEDVDDYEETQVPAT